MSACQKCWSDAHRGDQYSVAEEYSRILESRRDNPCSPEEQAGPGAAECPMCGRMTLHEITEEPMCGCAPMVRDARPRLGEHRG
jgi:hypothetical protein